MTFWGVELYCIANHFLHAHDGMLASITIYQILTETEEMEKGLVTFQLSPTLQRGKVIPTFIHYV